MTPRPLLTLVLFLAIYAIWAINRSPTPDQPPTDHASSDPADPVADYRQQGREFLAKNRTAEGVVETSSGLQYKVLESGDGPSPGPGDAVRCNYVGKRVDGVQFDASADRGGPAQFRVRGVIPGWTEALQLMHVGDKWQLIIPAELAYGNQSRGSDIRPGETLIFDIELMEIVE
jgi:FKBP-type peptidyl-prolyl cis-trans isomerase FklB